MAFRHELFIWSGRIIPFILLILALIFSIAEHVDRDKNGYPIDPKVQEYYPAAKQLHEIIKQNPIGAIQTTSAATCSEGQPIVLKNWTSIEGCYCQEKFYNTSCSKIGKSSTPIKSRRNHHPMLLWSESSVYAPEPVTKSANAYPVTHSNNRMLNVKKNLQKPHRQAIPGCENSGIPAKEALAKSFKNRIFCAVEIKNWTLPVQRNESIKQFTCGKDYKFCEEAQICVGFEDGKAATKCPVTELEYLSETAVKGNVTLATSRVISGQAFDDGFGFYVDSKKNVTVNKSQVLAGFRVTRDSDPCIHPDVYSSPAHPLQPNATFKDKCASFANSAVFKKIADLDLKAFWAENKESKFFDALPTYYWKLPYYASLYQVLKPQIKSDIECHKIINSALKANLTVSTDLGEVAYWRYVSNLTTYIIVAIAVFSFLVYLMLKAKMAETPLSYVIFWFCHICCVVLALVLVVYGTWTFGQIKKLKEENKIVLDISQQSCLVDSHSTKLFGELGSGIKSSYEKVAFYAELLIDISICFLVLEVLYLIWYACSFKCKRNIEEDEEEEEEGK